MSDDNHSLRDTIEPKSDQLNADDLMGTTKTITITDVKRGDSDQPVMINYEGDNGRPYKPCKSMRRVMIHAWGDDGRQWIGQRMTLYQDPEVKFGGVKVGGIRISHLSGIDQPMSISLTATRGKRSPYKVEPVKEEAPKAYPQAEYEKNLPAWRDAIAAGKMTADQVVKRAEKKGALTDEQKAAIREPIAEREPGSDDEPIEGETTTTDKEF